MVWQGLFNKEKYQIFIDGELYREIKPGNFNFYITIPLDSNIKGCMPLNFDIYRKGKFGLFFRDTNCGAFYNEEKKFLIIYRNHKLKRRFAIDAIWSDELFRFR